MAEKQFARSGNGPDIFADDDPLAELARIVGFEPKPVAANTQKREPTFTNIRPVESLHEPSPEVVAAQPQHPIFNLEDELLREFELYDTPRNDNSVPERSAQQLDIVPETDTVRADVKPERQEPRLDDDVQPQPVAVADEPVSDILDELREALAFAPAKVDPEPIAAVVEPVAEPQAPAISERREPSFDAAAEFDLASELEMAIGRVEQPEAPVVAVAEPAPAAPSQKPAAPFRSLATNFSVQRAAAARPIEEPAVEKPVAEAPKAAEPEVVKAEPKFDDLAIEWDRLANDLQLDPIEPETVAKTVAAPAALAADDLLADVSRYPVPERPQAAPAVTLTPEAAAGFARPQEPAVTETADEPSFDLDFGEFELELSQMSFDEPLPPVRAQAQARPAAIPVAMPEPEPVRDETPAVVTPEPPLAVLPEPDDDGELPFDPSLIADAEEHLEHVPHLDVPNLPVVEPEETIAPEPEYDIDIDAEMANLFAKSAEAEPVAARADAGHFDSGKAAIDEFDEFERALEEDFRRAMGEPGLTGDSQAQPMILGPGTSYAGVEQPARRLPRRLIAGVALAVIAMAGVVGAYSYFFEVDGAGGSTGPRVIAADKEPIKVVPENPGGKTVPNQDKAVYDRVAGNAAETPKQDSLLSSTEDPVDVVQRTLSPENLPLEGGADAEANMPTPVGETEDTRLLSGEVAHEGGTSKAEATPAVSPRKVRTMVVKSDGTLVPRETVETPVAETPIKPSLAEPVQQKPVPTEDRIASPDTVEDAVAAAAQEEPPLRTVRTTKIENTPVPASRPAEQPVNVVGTVTEQGNVKPAAKQVEAPQQVASAAPGSYVMQVASVPSEADAKRAYDSLTKKFGSLLGGRGYEIKKAEIAGKGTFYRVRIPVGSKDEAAALCVKYRSAGGSCLITK